MDWIWDHLQFILVAAGAIAVWLNNRRREKSGELADYDEDGVPDRRSASRPHVERRELTPVSRDGTDPEQAERVRRIQEEIRRKIAERRGQTSPPPMPAPVPESVKSLRPVFREQPSVLVQRTTPPPMPAGREVATVYEDKAAIERQHRMAEQLAELEMRRREARQDAQALAEDPVSVAGRDRTHASVSGTAVGDRGLVAELRDPKALRRVMVLREVLGPPVALRRG